MIKIIQDNGLEDFSIRVSFYTETNDKWGFELETLNIESLGDIGHSDKIVTFDVQ